MPGFTKSYRDEIGLVLTACLLVGVILAALVFQLFLSHQRALNELDSLLETSAELERIHEISLQVEELRNFSSSSLSLSNLSEARFLSLYDNIQAELSDLVEIIEEPENRQLLNQMVDEIHGYRESFMEAVSSTSITEKILNEDLTQLSRHISEQLNRLENSDNAFAELGQVIELSRLNITTYAYRADRVNEEGILGSIEFIRQQVENSSVNEDARTSLLASLASYQQLLNQVISQTHNYLYLTNVVLAGRASEYIYLSETLKAREHEQFNEESEITRAQLNQARRNTIILSVALLLFVIGSVLALGYFLYRLAYTEKSLKDVSQRHELIIENADTGIAEVTRDGRWITVNQKLCDLFGYSKEELLSLQWKDITHPDHMQTSVVLSQQAVDGEIDHYVLDKQYIKKDGSVIWARLKATAHRDEQGNFLNFISTFENIDDLKQQEGQLVKQLEERLQALERSNAELEQFAYVASHDLQEPLRMVSSYLQLVEDRYKNLLDKDGKEFIDYAVNGAVRMQDLIKSLLEYSRVGRTDEKMQDLVSMESVVASAKENLQDQINSSGAVITCDHLPEVTGHRYQLTQLIQNLVSNAIKYRVHGQTPKIHISASQQKEAPGWLFSVQDNGIGFEQMHADKIFVIFRRLHTKEEYAGTGIGLAICKKIVERHGGRIWVESSPGKGSTFYFTLHSVAV